MGNPFIFEKTKQLLLENTESLTNSMDIKIKAARKHLSLAVYYKGEKTACREMKKQLCSYTKGQEGSAELRKRIVRAESLDEYREIFKEYLF